MKEKTGYIPQGERKKILLLTDDIRVHSGVAQIGREIVINTSHRYNWVQIAGAIKHPEKGKKLLIQDILIGCLRWKVKLGKVYQLHI